MIIKNFTIVFKKIYLHMHIKEKFLLPLYTNVCISITPSPPLPLDILNGWSPEPSAFMFKKKWNALVRRKVCKCENISHRINIVHRCHKISWSNYSSNYIILFLNFIIFKPFILQIYTRNSFQSFNLFKEMIEFHNLVSASVYW